MMAGLLMTGLCLAVSGANDPESALLCLCGGALSYLIQWLLVLDSRETR